MKYLVLFAVFMGGCASFQTYQQVADFKRPEEYVRFFKLLDQTVKEADRRDASVFTIPGFPYLRANRFIAGLKTTLRDDASREQWVQWMRRLDLAARRKEIKNLPLGKMNELAERLGATLDRKNLMERTIYYSNRLLDHDGRQSNFYSVLQSAIVAPSEYSTAMRVIGIYPLTSIPVASVTRRLQEEFRQWHNAPADQIEILGRRIAFGPPPGPEFSQNRVRLILARSSLNALGVPLPSSADRQILLAMFAPVIYQDVAAAYDEIGEVVWHNHKVSVDPAKPTVYFYLSHALLKGKPVLQLNYVFWYSARNGQLSPRIERGPLDGLTVRVSLDNDGQPFMVDIMNNCGCYHFFVPHPQKPAKIIAQPNEIDAFVARRMPAAYPRQRLRLWTMSGWHQVNHMDAVEESNSFVPYQLVDYNRLEMLPHNELEFESIFNSRGIAKDSPRIESLIFFPMGITDIGSMRQRGHHAVLFIGRAHFDDPELFDQNFSFQP